MNLFILGWLISIGMITYGDLRYCHDLPWPPRILAAALAFGMLDMFSVVSEELASFIAIGFVIAIVANTLNMRKGGSLPKNSLFFASDCEARTTAATQQPSVYDSIDQNPYGAPQGGVIAT